MMFKHEIIEILQDLSRDVSAQHIRICKLEERVHALEKKTKETVRKGLGRPRKNA